MILRCSPRLFSAITPPPPNASHLTKSLKDSLLLVAVRKPVPPRLARQEPPPAIGHPAQVQKWNLARSAGHALGARHGQPLACIVSSKPASTSDKAPDLRVIVSCVEIGAAWRWPSKDNRS